MKKIFLLIVLTFAFHFYLNAQTFEASIQNQNSENNNELSFDIYLLRTGTEEIYLANSDFIVTFNSANFTNPTYEVIQFGEIGGTLETWYSFDILISSSNRATLNVLQPNFSNQTQFDQRVLNVSNVGFGSLIASVKITGITNAAGTANLQWRTSSPNNTVVSTFENVSPWNVTDISDMGTYINPPDAPLPVELNTFTVKAAGESIQLTWQTKTEINNYGFEIERKSGSLQKELNSWDKIGFVQGSGNSNSDKNYSFKDKNLSGGSKFIYRLKQIDNDGTFAYSDEVEIEFVPNKYELFQNYPNPFNPETTIKFSLPVVSRVRLDIYNILGQRVMTLLDKEMEPGFYNVPFNAINLASGTYIYRIQAEEFSQTKKMLLVK